MQVSSKYRYESPFPRGKKNEELLQKTRSCYFKDKKKIEVVVPAKVTKEYMSTNRYYFDTQKWKSIHTTTERGRPKSAIITKPKASQKPSTAANNINYLNWVVDLQNIQKVLSYQNDEDIQGIVIKEVDMKGERAVRLRQEYSAAFQFNKLSPKKFLEQMIETKYKPHFHRYFGQIPE
jgi:hypothetical protein